MKTYLCQAILSCLISLCFSLQLLAQTERVNSHHFTMRDGLSHDYVLCVLQDSQGFLWVGTESGLNQFDGHSFKNYLENPWDSTALTNNKVNALWEDSLQRLWIGTNAGVELFDLTTGKFSQPLPEPLHATNGFDIQVRDIHEGPDGMLWICSGAGLFRFDPQTFSVQGIPLMADSYEAKAGRSKKAVLWGIDHAQDGTLWVASESGLISISPDNLDITFYQHDPNDPASLTHNEVWSVYVGPDDRVWAGTSKGLDLFHPETETFTHHIPQELQASYSSSNRLRVNALYPADDQQFWVGFSTGLYRYDPDKEAFNYILDNFTQSVFRDQHDALWVGTQEGLYLLESVSNKFKLYNAYQDSRVTSPAGLAEDNHENIWLSAWDSDQNTFSLFRFDPSTSELYAFNQENHHSATDLSGGIISLAYDSWQSLWGASFGKLQRLNLRDQSVTSLSLSINPHVTLIDSRDELWIGEWTGLGKLNTQRMTYERLADLPSLAVNALIEAPDQTIWIGTDQGLFCYNPVLDSLSFFQNDAANPYSLSNNKVNHLMFDEDGALWVATNGGLNKMFLKANEDSPIFNSWRSMNSGLPSDAVHRIVAGEDNTLWVSSGKSLSHFDPSKNLFRNYDDKDGLPGVRLNRSLKSKAGAVYFGSGNGLTVFHPDSLRDNPYIPPVWLTNFTIHNEQVPVKGSYGDTLAWESPLERTITRTSSVEIAYWQNDFSLEFAALNYINPEKNQYKYRLEPYEEEWISTTAANRIARYTNLSPGEYTFRVKASNNDGLWNEAGTSLQLTILPPWWQTTGAYVLYGLLGLGLLFSLRQYTVKRERLKHELNLQRMEAEKMHTVDQMKSRFFANISHEFRTPLTLILGPLEKYVRQSESGSSEQQTFRMMRRNARRLLHLINQLLDLSKLEAGKMQLQPTPQMIQSFLQPIGMSFSTLAERKQISYHFRYPKENPVLYFDADKLEKIITNLLSNAFKFTPAGEEIIFSASLKPATGKTKSNGSTATQILELEVKDRGEGMEEEQLQHIFQRFYQAHTTQDSDSEGSGIGLSLVKELVELHGGEISVSSEKDQGSSFLVHLPLEEADFEAFISEPARQKDSFISEEPEQKEDTEDKQTDAPIQEDESIPLLLVVEDNADVRVFIRETLKSDYRLLEADNGREGYKKAVEAIPDLILSDVMMPGMDGVELCGKLKADEKTSHVPIILLTAKASGGDKIEGLQTGADDYIVKPFEAMELAARIENLIESRRKLREQFSREITLQPSAIQITSADEQFLQEVMEIVEANMANFNFSEAVLHQQMSLSKTQLYRKLKALTDHAPNELIQMMRLKRAAELLAAKAGNVGEISFVVGFRDHSYFSRRFHKQYGMTPSEYAASVAK